VQAVQAQSFQQTNASVAETPQGPKGLGGWLILVCISLFINLLIGLVIFVVGNNQSLVLLGTTLIACAGVALVFFFKKSRLFPLVFIGIIVVGFVLAIISNTKEALTQQIIYAAIWIPYVLLSKRVKNTFVH
jgi:CHASE2 domain-containing sensor protein